MFKGNRVLAQRCDESGRLEWYFQAREGLMGPYDTEEQAGESLKKFVARRIRLGLDGGRSRKNGLTMDIFQHNPKRSSTI